MQYNLSYLPQNEQKAFEKRIGQNHFYSKKLTVNQYDNAFVLPPENKVHRGGVYYDSVLLDETILHYDHLQEKNLCFEAKKIDKEVVFIGSFIGVWGHCITDNLRHLWFTLYEEYDFLKEKLFVYIEHQQNGEKLPDTFFEMLKKLGIERDKMLKITEPTQFAKVYVPNKCVNNCTYTNEYHELIKKIACNVVPKNDCKKIYFTRTALKNSRGDGEKFIETLFKKNGYTIVSPEKLSLDEQIALLKGANTIAGTEGSIMHNCVFIDKAINLVILRKASYVNDYQIMLNKLISGTVTYINAHASCMATSGYEALGPFFLYASKNLCKFLNEKKVAFPIKNFLHYVKNNIKTKIINELYKFAEPIFGKQVRKIKKLLAKKN